LLEVCDWDDKRASYVKELLESTVAEILSSSDIFSSESLIEEIKNKMLGSINEKELEVCLHIISGMLKSPEHFKGAGYEN